MGINLPVISQPPFPEPTDEAGAILAIGQIAFIFIIMGMYLFLMWLACKNSKFPLTLLVWGFSIDLAFGMFVAPVFPFKPMLPTFFMLWQTVLLLECSLKFYKGYKVKKGRY